MPNFRRRIVGISPRNSADTSHAAISDGSVTANTLRAAGGTETCGRSEAMAPALRAAVSGVKIAKTSAISMTAARMIHTIAAADDENWAITPEKSAPTPIPAAGARPAMTPARCLRLSGASSRIAALNELVAAAVATPWMMRAAMIQLIEGETRNTSMETSSSASAPMSSGRRPMWSDSDPMMSSVRRSAIAYTPKATVTIEAGKFHFAS